MENLVVIFIILIICLLLLSFPLKCNPKNKNSNVEGFYTYQGYYKKYCPSCGWRSRYSCSNCTNCGWCITKDGNGQCVPGDGSGPYFRNDCMYWEYNDPYFYYPYSNIYPIVKIRSNYPRYNYTVTKPWRGKNLKQKR